MKKYEPSKVYTIGEVTCREYARLDIIVRTCTGLSSAECMSTGQWVNQSFHMVDTAIDCALATIKIEKKGA